ncbi:MULTISPECIES: MFS transporter AraJ [Lelliottia]|jgi:DHA1 family arabinose polymer transporter-like MFS transporter|uniref:MFS transporter AraJ n=1 Tax=Lelliottia nimipressuralis TaxID=69220 RepID=A0ABY3P6T3_9ENTR|nr:MULTISPECIES: MFS transporter AraJ [Lelliottia]MDH6632621.1 DHA1 family arabinose polymer transporter-like MFS transporter [Lelliottia amnigena]PKA31880.1 MFS transporter AraJ [Cedecea lapagei]PLY48045.1 MFS transporter AraJ [Lelliottia sp. F159]PLY52522.1 MFS transporter AraJ [Lelliottia sp. F154]PLY55859.1 MFS transporter AraJ [Lelliottia sp. F153]
MKKTVFSLALGTFGLGMAEFGIMGVLTELAHDTGISIPSAGSMISYYAFGVVIGAPIIALFSNKFSLKTVLLFLVALCVVGNAIFTFSTSYFWLAIGRLVSGFPHGAFFGVGAIILSKIAPPGKVTLAVSGMIAGMTVANLVGVPLGTWLGHEYNWRYTFFLIAAFDALVILSVIFWVPTLYDKTETRLTEQFHFLKKPEPWLIFAATMFGNAGVFAWFSFVKPFMVNVSGFSAGFMTVIMMLMGLGMVLGNLLSGKLSGRYSPLRIAATTDLVIVVSLLMLFAFGENQAASLVMGFICCAGLFALSAPLQIMLLQNAQGGELLGAAGGQVAFNLGSAIGAYFGGMMIVLGYSWSYVTLPAALLSFAAMSSLLLYGRQKAKRAEANASALA